VELIEIPHGMTISSATSTDTLGTIIMQAAARAMLTMSLTNFPQRANIERNHNLFLSLAHISVVPYDIGLSTGKNETKNLSLWQAGRATRRFGRWSFLD